MNKSLNVYDWLPPEPTLTDYRDLQRWDKWFAWDRKREKHCWAKTVTHADGRCELAYWWRLNRRYWQPRSKLKRRGTVGMIKDSDVYC